MKILICIFLNVLTLINSQESKFDFEGYRLYRVFAKTNNDIELFHRFQLYDSGFDIWNFNVIAKSFDVLLSPKSIKNYTLIFDSHSLNYIIIDDNIQNKINQQLRSIAQTRQSNNILFKYARYSEIINYLNTVAFENSDIASLYNAGYTYENRQLKVIRIKAPTPFAQKSVWIDCGIHAREWVTPATCVYIIDKLISEYRNNEPENLLNKYEFHILPILNPDGYDFTFAVNRLWRKNRSKNPKSFCMGTDLNRNFNYGWRTGGSSTDPCAETYSGAGPDSENETKAVINAINAKLGDWIAYLNIHSYGNLWLTPFGNSTTVVPSNYNDLIAKGNIGADAIKAFSGQTFSVGSSSSLLYINSGSGKDWALAMAKIPYSYVLELRPGLGDPDYSYGFMLPEDRMVYVAPETFIGIKAFLNSI